MDYQLRSAGSGAILIVYGTSFPLEVKPLIFKASALWADAFYKSICLYVCVSVCVSVCLFTF